ncbi:MAG: AMP-binding protein, partial [Bacteroidales bacterium]|nr:AMP-binding protein [Bacteroidales bacterium]
MKNIGLTTQSRYATYAGYGFDAYQQDLWSCVYAGATICIVSDEIRFDLEGLNRYIQSEHITHCFMTTQMATQLVLNYPDIPGLQWLGTGGEKLISLDPPKYRLLNGYGPTESTVYVSSYYVERNEPNIPIGKANANGTKLFVVGQDGKEVPKGTEGELYVSGPQVGLGYLNKPEKTAEVFVEWNGVRCYRTGDIVRVREDGNIEFVGRRDGQVKIRGFRIELKEVEEVIRDYEGIKDATVQAYDYPDGGKFIAAYVVSDTKIDVAALNAFIMDRKPPYMVPAVTMQIDAIPLNANQKVDKRALPKPEAPKADSQASKTEAAPLNVLEEELSALIKESVGIGGFGLTDPLYFSGLSSIAALRLATELYNRYGLEPDMNTFAKTASLQSIENDLLKLVFSQRGKAQEAASEEDAADEPQELTFQQTGLYLDCVKNPSSTAYNLPFILNFPEGTQAEELKKALQQILEAHPAVLGNFEQRDGKVVLVPGKLEEDIPYTQLKREEDFLRLKESFMQPYNLSTGPLYRLNIVKTPEKLRLMGDFHHLVFDGRSYDVFLAELTAALEGKAPEKESYTYFHYAKDQKAYQESASFQEAEDFFNTLMAGKEEETGLIPDKKPQEDEVGHEVWLRKKLGADVIARCHALGISPASYFLAASLITVSGFSGQQKVFMCTVANGRNDMRSSNTFGMFVNTLALTGEVKGQNAADFLKETDETFSKALSYQNYPFARLSSAYDFHPAVMMAYQVGLVEKYSINGQVLEDELMTQDTPKFPLSIFIEGTEEAPEIALAYDDSL